jgi:hypothetical protein
MASKGGEVIWVDRFRCLLAWPFLCLGLAIVLAAKAIGGKALRITLEQNNEARRQSAIPEAQRNRSTSATKNLEVEFAAIVAGIEAEAQYPEITAF